MTSLNYLFTSSFNSVTSIFHSLTLSSNFFIFSISTFPLDESGYLKEIIFSILFSATSIHFVITPISSPWILTASSIGNSFNSYYSYNMFLILSISSLIPLFYSDTYFRAAYMFSSRIHAFEKSYLFSINESVICLKLDSTS